MNLYTQERGLCKSAAFLAEFCSSDIDDCTGNVSEKPAVRSAMDIDLNSTKKPDRFSQNLSVLPHKAIYLAPHRQQFYNNWLKHLEEYLKFDLTDDMDKLPAFSGIISAYSPHLGENIAGLWKSNIELQLLWQIALPEVEGSERYYPSKRSNSYRAPS